MMMNEAPQRKDKGHCAKHLEEDERADETNDAIQMYTKLTRHERLLMTLSYSKCIRPLAADAAFL